MSEPTSSASTGSPAVRVKALVKRYGTSLAVDRLDLVARQGAVTAVLGPNGAGKTTTIEICEGLRSPDSGVVEVLGRSPGDPELRGRVGVMLQDGGIYGSVSAAAALRHAAALYRAPHDPDRLLEALGLSPVAGVPFRRLSGGQKQLVSLALALVGRPELVFLDEPTAGLDPHSRRQVWELVTDLRAAGVGVVLTTHYLEEAEQLADHVVIVDHGRVIASGDPQSLVGAASDQPRLTFRAAPGLQLRQLADRLPPSSTVVEVRPGEYELTAPGLVDALAVVTAWFAEVGVTPTAVSTEHRSLEDVFIELTGEDRP